MKVLFITSTPLEYNSSANMRNRALISGLQELGYEISTLSASYDKNSIYTDKLDERFCFKKRYWIDFGKFHSNITNNIKESNKIKKKIKEVCYKIYNKFSIYDSRKTLVAQIKANMIDEKFDIIISSSDPKSAHLIAEKLISLNPNICKKWIQYWGDPFIGDINKKTIIPDYFIKKEEKRLIGLCDKVVYVSPFTLEKQKDIYKQFSKKMDFVPIPFEKEKIYNKTENNKVYVGYFGDYNCKDRNIIPLYNCIVENTEYFLNICGNSDMHLQDKENIKIQNRQKINVLEKLEEKCDILTCVCNRKGTQIPGKIYHYAATNKPILIILDGEEKEELKNYFISFNRYEICDNNENSIKLAINRIIDKNIEYKPLEKLKAKNIAKTFIK